MQYAILRLWLWKWLLATPSELFDWHVRYQYLLYVYGLDSWGHKEPCVRLRPKSPMERGTFGGHTWTWPNLLRFIFSVVFARRQKWCGLRLPVYCSNLYTIKTSMQQATVWPRMCMTAVKNMLIILRVLTNPEISSSWHGWLATVQFSAGFDV